MATTTPNFGWDIPQSTDLVKDGATAIAALGTDIDTALVDLKGGTTGQVLSKASNTDLDFTWVAQDDSNAIQNALLTTTGDTIYASGASTPARLGIGTSGQVLTVSGGVPTWASPAAAGGLTQIASGSLSSTTTTISSINQNYKHLYLRIRAAQVNTGALPCFRLNGDSSTIYSNFRITLDSTVVNASGAVTFIRTSGANIPTTANNRGWILYIENYAESNVIKPIFSRTLADTATGDSSSVTFSTWNNTAAITSIGITTDTGTPTFSAGTYTLFGVN